MRNAISVTAVVIVIVVAIAFYLTRTKAARKLTADEELILGLAHELYGDHIVSEEVAFSGHDATLKLTLRDEKVATMQVNLSKLARKHREEGLSAAAIKLALKIS